MFIQRKILFQSFGDHELKNSVDCSYNTLILREGDIFKRRMEVPIKVK
jgi:hypothetical protein